MLGLIFWPCNAIGRAYEIFWIIFAREDLESAQFNIFFYEK